MLALVSSPSNPGQFSDAVAGITALLAARHDSLTILRAVTDACAAILDADATGVLVRDPRGGGFEVVDASDARARFAEFLQTHVRQGPCLDCIEHDTVVSSGDLASEQRWPQFASEATAAGYRAIYAFPLRLIDHAIGGLNVFYAEPTTFSDLRLLRAQALADLAVLGLTQERDQRRVERLAERTLTTLNDRAQLNQAVGIVAASLQLQPEAARFALSAFSARSGRPLLDIAKGLTDGSLPAATILTAGK
jgi:transcriptional regulator with GAF, ATPase, and Fis domain